MGEKLKHSSLQHCHHPYFIRNKCIQCGKSRSLTTKCGNQATLPFTYLQPKLTLTFQDIHRRREDNLQCLLSRKKLHLLLDLDHTLVHSTRSYHNEFTTSKEELEPIKAMDDTFEILNGMYMVKLRPGVRQFLEQVSSMFDLSVYTLSQRIYATEVVKLFDEITSRDNNGCSRFSSVISKEDCLKAKQKGLDIVLSHEKVVLIVDDSKKVWKESGSENLINVSPYYFFPDNEEKKEMDEELDRVLSILKEVHSAFYDDDFCCHRKVNYSNRDVRKVLPRALSKHKMKESPRLNSLYRFLRKICID